jgi:hypothetical protein
MRGYRDSKAYFKKFSELMGKGGGFIIGAVTVIAEGNTGNVKAWFEFTRECGAYD